MVSHLRKEARSTVTCTRALGFSGKHSIPEPFEGGWGCSQLPGPPHRFSGLRQAANRPPPTPAQGEAGETFPGASRLRCCSPSFPACSCPRKAGRTPQHPHAVLHRAPGLWPGDRTRHPVQEPLRGSVPLHHLRGVIFHPVHSALLAAVRLLPEQKGKCLPFSCVGPERPGLRPRAASERYSS